MYIWDLWLHQMRSFTESVSISNKIFRVSLYVHGYVYACVSLCMSPVKKMCVLVLEKKKVRRVSCCGELCCGIGSLGRFCIYKENFMEVSLYF
jgi:hypothetical protein